MNIKLDNGMDFVNDEQVIGKWEFFDCIESIEPSVDDLDEE